MGLGLGVVKEGKAHREMGRRRERPARSWQNLPAPLGSGRPPAAARSGHCISKERESTQREKVTSSKRHDF